jgi:ADP-ribose pyrophosphatase
MSAENEKMSRQIDWIDSERLLEGFFTVDKIRFRHSTNDGQMSPELSWFLLRRPDAVCAVVYNTEREVMYFVKQFRLGVIAKGDPAWAVELAAGVVDPGESRHEAILREVREELGFEVTQAVEVQMFYPSPAILSERIYLYYVEVSDDLRTSDGGGTTHEHEDLEVIEVPVIELQEFVERNQITDGKTLIGLAWFMAGKGRS